MPTINEESKNLAIKIESVSKSFKLYNSRYDMIKESFHPLRKKYHKKFEALKDISFSVAEGEVIGIIGKNGSGKSTLLKILTSVVTPTKGSYECKGRVTALLELGAGFNMDLTGVENVYYLGAIQGITKREMAQKIPQILKFADIGDYAYQPVSRYSSGMYVRLAFSMAINIDPEILIIDEALSVGDIRFQQRCFRKIKEFKDKGKTILICTHSLTAIRDFCTKAIWIDNGKIREEGDTGYVTACYNEFMMSELKDLTNKAIYSLPNSQSSTSLRSIILPEFKDIKWHDLSRYNNFGLGGVKLLNGTLISKTTRNLNVSAGDELKLLLHYSISDKEIKPIFEVILNGQFGSPVFKISSFGLNQHPHVLQDKTGIVSFDFTFPHIGNGRYTISFGAVSDPSMGELKYHWVHDAIILEVNNDDPKYRQDTILVLETVSFENIDFQYGEE